MMARWGALTILACALPLAAWQVAPPPDPNFQNEAKSPADTKPKAELKSKNEAKSPADAKTGAAAPPAPAGKGAVLPSLGPLRTVTLAGSPLGNGMRVYLIENHELPVFFGLAVLRAGRVFDPPDRAGLARLTGIALLSSGTRQQTGEQLDSALAGLGARIGTAVSETTGLVSFSGLKEGAADVLRMVRDLLQEPAFRLEKVELAKTQMRLGLARRDDDALGSARRELASALYGLETPYGRREDEAAIARIRRADVEAFYKRYYFPANVTLAVEGDFDAAKLRAEIEGLFAGWTAGTREVPEFPPVSPAPAAGIYIAPGRDLARTALAMGQPGIVWRDRDASALAVLMSILGGSRHGRLLDHLPSSTVNPTHIGVFCEPKFAYPGLLELATSTGAVSFPRVLETIHTEIERLRSAEVTEQELRWGKDAVLETMAREGDAGIKRLARDLECDFFGYPAGFVAQYQKAVAAVTRADVQRVAKERLQWDRFTMVAVGDSVDLRRQLANLGRPVLPLEGRPAPARAEPAAGDAEGARRILQKAIEASGGMERLAAWRDLTETVAWEYGPQSGAGQALETHQWMPPNYFRQQISGPQGRAIVYTDGRAGWVSNGRGTGPLGGAVFERVQGDLFRLYPRLLLSGTVEGRTAFALDEESIEIREGERVAQVIFDGESGLPSKVLYQDTAANGAPVAMEEDLLDFREVEGIKLPFTVKILRNGQEAAVLTVREAKINQGLKLIDLLRRP